MRTIFKRLRTLLGGRRPVHHLFNRDLVRARVIIHHIDRYKGETVVPHPTIAEYDGGDWAVCSVPFQTPTKEGLRFYLYNVLTCAIQETDAEFSLPRQERL